MNWRCRTLPALPGNGLSAVLRRSAGSVGGSMTFIKEKSGLSEAMQEICNRLAAGR